MRYTKPLKDYDAAVRFLDDFRRHGALAVVFEEGCSLSSISKGYPKVVKAPTCECLVSMTEQEEGSKTLLENTSFEEEDSPWGFFMDDIEPTANSTCNTPSRPTSPSA